MSLIAAGMDPEKRGFGAGLAALACFATTALAFAQGVPPPPPPTPGSSAPSGLPPPSTEPTASAPPPAPAPPPPAPSAAPAPTAPPTAVLKLAPPPTSALVHVYSSHPNAVLELRGSVDADDAWVPACSVPCDRVLKVENMDARVRAPGMTTSNAFRIEPGQGTASLKVKGGSASSRQIGLIGLISGIPIALTGMSLFGYGQVDENKGLRTAGIATLAVGGAVVLASLPFLAAGTTRIQDARGKTIAKRGSAPRF